MPMFDNCPLLALIETKNKSIQVKRISEDRASQQAIDATFSTAAAALKRDKTSVAFDGKYTPQADDLEILKIENYRLPMEIQDALINPQGLDVYEPVDGTLPSIKALFVGEQTAKNGKNIFCVAFQKFRNDQYITAARHHLFFSNNTFIKDTRVGIAVGTSVDCVFLDNTLYFASYHFAKQILDLSEYYRIASNQDVSDFVGCDIISMEGATEFVDSANTWERRKIASINDSGVLQSFTAAKIKSLGKQSGVVIEVVDKKVVLPKNKAERRIILGFLDEEVYKGVFSQTVFQTNSKRKAK